MASRRVLIGCQWGILVGLALTLAGVLWPWTGGGRGAWTKQQAHEYQEAYAAVHEVITKHGRQDPAVARRTPEYLAAAQRFKELETQLQSARFYSQSLGSWLFRIGLATTAASGLGYLAAHR